MVHVATSLVFTASLASAQMDLEEPQAASSRAENKAVVAALHQQHLKEFKDAPDVMARPGLVANRLEKTVRIWAEGTGMNLDDPIEFFLIAENSGKDYEALAVSFTRPLHIYEALEFIGMEAGRPVGYDAMEMWPKGERVLMTYEWEERGEDGKPIRKRVPAEKLLIDIRTGRPLPVMGFAFTGSTWVAPEEAGGEKLLAADAYDPHAIASDYNERLALLDVPRKAVDGEVYGYQRVNPGRRLPPDGLLQIVLEPEYKDGKKRIVDLALHVTQEEGGADDTLEGLVFQLRDKAGNEMATGQELKHVLAAFARLTKDGRDPFVSVSPAEDLSVGAVHELYAFLASIATDNGIRLEPPRENHLFYKAFLPNKRFRKREGRPTQPTELHLQLEEEDVSARLVLVEERWVPEKETPELDVEEFTVSDPADLQARFEKAKPEVPVLLVFAEKDVTYGTVLSYVTPMLPLFPTIYVFLP